MDEIFAQYSVPLYANNIKKSWTNYLNITNKLEKNWVSYIPRAVFAIRQMPDKIAATDKFCADN